MSGLQIGVVAAFETDPDNEFRVKVILPGIDATVAKGAVWARLAAPYAGENHGYVFRPEAGDEVVVGFMNADPRQAVIIGAMHSSKNKPPEALSPPDEDNTKKGIVSKKGMAIRFSDVDEPVLTIETPNANRIVLDEEEKSIRIEDQNGNTITMHEDGITIKTDEKLVIEAKSITIKAEKGIGLSGENVTVTAKKRLGVEGKNVTLKADSNVDIKGQKVDVK